MMIAEAQGRASQAPPMERTTLLHPKVLLRAESIAILALVPVLYWQHGGSWWLFGLIFFVPDVALIVYAINQRAGTLTYNLMHTYLMPALLALAGFAASGDLAISIAIIWTGHIALDRSIGYGLKYAHSFKETHLQRV